MPRRRKRPPIPVRLTLPAEPPAQAEIDAILRAWFPHEVRKVRQAINHTLQAWGERPSPHPSKTSQHYKSSAA